MFTWKGTEVATIGQLLDAAVAAVDSGEAREFLAAYETENIYARANLGYVIGYCDKDTRARLYEAFDLNHPVFGGRP